MASENWPPPQGLCTPTVASKDVTLPLYYAVTVNAPASLVWEILLDTSKYPDWNTWVPRVAINSQPDGSKSSILQKGTEMTFEAIMNADKPNSSSPTSLKVYDISTPDAPSDYVSQELLDQGSFTKDVTQVYRISWKVQGGYASRGLRSERYHEIIILDDERCEVRSWETMAGILARAVKWTYGSVLPLKFKQWAEDLKQHSEKVASSRKGTPTVAAGGQ